MTSTFIILPLNTELFVQSSAPSTNTTTGAIQVTGGIGVTGNVYANTVYSNNYFNIDGTYLVGAIYEANTLPVKINSGSAYTLGNNRTYTLTIGSKSFMDVFVDGYKLVKGNDYADLDWLSTDIPKPSQEELENEMNRLHEIWLKNEYQRQRQPEYPNLADQLDMLWHAIDQGKLDTTSSFYQSLKAVKDKYPKGS